MAAIAANLCGFQGSWIHAEMLKVISAASCVLSVASRSRCVLTGRALKSLIAFVLPGSPARHVYASVVVGTSVWQADCHNRTTRESQLRLPLFEICSCSGNLLFQGWRLMILDLPTVIVGSIILPAQLCYLTIGCQNLGDSSPLYHYRSLLPVIQGYMFDSGSWRQFCDSRMVHCSHCSDDTGRR